MTIKQAFEKLTAVTAAAMKNPFFVMRKLHDAFADIADKVEGGGGGSTVEVTQVLSSGTKIATITVDDTPTDLYAPAASSQNYSTTERVVGKWIDGTTDVYERTWDFSSSPIVLEYNNWVDSGISASEHISRIISAEVRFNSIVLADVETGVGADDIPVGFQKLTNITSRSVTDCTLRYLKSTT